MLQRLPTFGVLALLCLFSAVQCCEKITFRNTTIRTSKYLGILPNTVLPKIVISGCLEPVDDLADVLQIKAEDQVVPVLNEGAVNGLQTLYSLSLDNNSIGVIAPEAFQDLPSLSVLSLQFNNIKELPVGVLNGLAIRRLYLNNNSISVIAPGAFDNLTNLVRVELDNNAIKVWNSDWFADSPNLQYISMNNNQLSLLPEGAFKNIKATHALFDGSVMATSILLANNKIKSISPTAFLGLDQLNILDLEGNEIKTLGGWVPSLKSVTYLMLNRNKIACVSELELSVLPKVELISLNDNPWDCVCLKSVQTWAKTAKQNVQVHTSAIDCAMKRIKSVLDEVKDIRVQVMDNIKGQKEEKLA